MKEFIFHGKNKDNRRFTVVGYCDEAQPNSVKFGVAVCSKKDNFCKKTGRLLATQRANSEDKFIKFLFTVDEVSNRLEFNREVRTLLYNLDWVSVYSRKFPPKTK